MVKKFSVQEEVGERFCRLPKNGFIANKRLYVLKPQVTADDVNEIQGDENSFSSIEPQRKLNNST